MDDDKEDNEDYNNNTTTINPQKQVKVSEEFFFPKMNYQFPSMKKKKKKWNILEVVLLFMSIVILMISIGILIVYWVIESVPSIYVDSQMKKSLADNKKYEVIRLLNGIEALLIYEPEAYKSSVSLSLDIGFLGDEEYGIPGLGQLVRFVLFNNETKAFRDINSLLIKHLGVSIKITKDLFAVTYSYDVIKDAFQESLALFAKILRMHIYTNNNTDDDGALKKSIELGIKHLTKAFISYNNEGNQLISIQNVLYRILGYGKEFNPSGNNKTFVNDTFTIDMLQEKVVRYYKDNYVGQKMKLVVMSGLSIKEIRGIVIKMFSNLPKAFTPLETFNLPNQRRNTTLPVSDSKLGKIVFFNYASNFNHFRIYFLFNNIPYDTTTYYFTYLTYLFNDKSTGSLTSLLISNNLITSLSTFSEYFNKETKVFFISFLLTQNGLSNIDLVYEQAFNFIRFIREKKPNEKIYNDMRSIHNTTFKFREETTNSLLLAEKLSRDMIKYKDKLPQILYSNDYIPRYNEEFNNAMFDLLTPQNSITVFSQKNVTSEGLRKLLTNLTDESELKYVTDNLFSIKYAERNFKQEYLNYLFNKNEYDHYFSIKKKNKYLTNLTTLVAPGSSEEKFMKAPKLIKNLNHLLVWHKLDRSFLVPTIHGYFSIYTPFYPSNKPEYFQMFRYYYHYVDYSINQILYEAQESGTLISVEFRNEYLFFSIKTFSDVFEVVLDQIFDIFFNVNRTIINTEFLMNIVRLSSHNFKVNEFSLIANHFFRGLLKNKLWGRFGTDDSFNMTNINQVIQEMNNNSLIQCMFYGNIDEATALKWSERYLQSKLKINSSFFSKEHELFSESEALPFFEEVKDYYKYIIFRLKPFNQGRRSFVGNYFYFGSIVDYRESILMELLYLVVLNDYQNELKAIFPGGIQLKISLGYNSYFVIFVSEMKDPTLINRELDGLFTTLEDKLLQLDEENELYKIKLNLMIQLTKKEKNLNDRTKEVFNLISINSLSFDPGYDYSIETINKNFTKQHLIDYYNKRFKTDIKKLSIQVNYTDVISMEEDHYLHNPNITSIVTDNWNYFH